MWPFWPDRLHEAARANVLRDSHWHQFSHPPPSFQTSLESRLADQLWGNQFCESSVFSPPEPFTTCSDLAGSQHEGPTSAGTLAKIESLSFLPFVSLEIIEFYDEPPIETL